jgi:hypothetical protein
MNVIVSLIALSTIRRSVSACLPPRPRRLPGPDLE